MTGNGSTRRELLISTLWAGAGLFAWYLSIYLFTYLLSPVFIKLIREVNAIPASPFIKNSANMFFVYFSDFLLCFIFALLLSLWTQPTKSRLALFVLGAVAFRIYAQVDVVTSQTRHYAEIPAWAVTSIVQGLIPPVLLVPLFSILGSRIGRSVKLKKKIV